jgi:hypothetical protein
LLGVIFNANGNKKRHSFDSIYDVGPDFCSFETAGFLAGLGLHPGIVANAQAGRGFQMTQIQFPQVLDTIRANHRRRLLWCRKNPFAQAGRNSA